MKRLSRSVFPVLFLLILSSCGERGQKMITAEVTLLHIPPSVRTAFLEEIRPTATLTIDSAAVDPLKGSFSFTFYPSGSEGLYRIRLGDSTGLLLVLNDEDVTVKGDYNQPGRLQTKGSPASGELQHFLAGLNSRNHHLQGLLQEYASLRESDPEDSLLKKQSALIDRQRRTILNAILDEARTTTSPVNAVFALSILDHSSPGGEVKAIFDGLRQRFPDNALVKQATDSFHKKLNNMGESMSVGAGDMAPDIRYPDTSGNMISLKSFRGKYVLVDFWASWCAPCRAQNLDLVKAWKKFRDKNFTILGVSLDTKKSSWEEAIRQDQLTWHHVSDLKGWNSAPAAVYGVEAIPADFLVNPEGKIIATDLKGDSLIRKLKAIFRN